jgi:cephalosporin-C deacetylase
MPLFDFPRDQLVRYAPDLAQPADLEAFWSKTLAEARAAAKPPVFEPVETGLTLVDTYDVTFSGFAGQPIRAWLHIPSGTSAPLPVVVRYQGYGGGRGLAHEVTQWPLAGYVCLSMDTRGQGSAGSPGDTPDPVGSAPAFPGFMTKGILDPDDYYYRRVFTDAVMAVDAIRKHPLARTDRVAVVGASQGGGISLAVSGLVPDLWAVMTDVPFLCDFPRATEIIDRDPYGEIVRYLKIHRDHVERVFATLSYFDGATLARSANAPALFSVALMDQVCPPSTVYAAYNSYGGTKEIVEYRFNDHEGGQQFHHAKQLRWLANRAAADKG